MISMTNTPKALPDGIKLTQVYFEKRFIKDKTPIPLNDFRLNSKDSSFYPVNTPNDNKIGPDEYYTLLTRGLIDSEYVT